MYYLLLLLLLLLLQLLLLLPLVLLYFRFLFYQFTFRSYFRLDRVLKAQGRVFEDCCRKFLINRCFEMIKARDQGWDRSYNSVVYHIPSICVGLSITRVVTHYNSKYYSTALAPKYLNGIMLTRFIDLNIQKWYVLPDEASPGGWLGLWSQENG